MDSTASPFSPQELDECAELWRLEGPDIGPRMTLDESRDTLRLRLKEQGHTWGRNLLQRLRRQVGGSRPPAASPAPAASTPAGQPIPTPAAPASDPINQKTPAGAPFQPQHQNGWPGAAPPGAGHNSGQRAGEKKSGANARRNRQRNERIEQSAKSNSSPLSDSQDFVATTFGNMHEGDLRYVAAWKKWVRYNGNHWQLDETLEARELTREVCRDFAKQWESPDVSTRGYNAAIEEIAKGDRRLSVNPGIWDQNSSLLGTPNGTVDLTTGQHRAPAREDYITKVTAVAPAGDCPQFKRFLAEATGGDAEYQRFLQKRAGYCASGSVKEQKLFFDFGAGGNGKGVFLNTLRYVFGDYARIAPPEMFMVTIGERHPTDIAMLRGARFVVSQEIEKTARWAESKIKSLTGGDPQSGRFMRGDFFEFDPQFKLNIAGNNKPGIGSVDNAIRRRVVLCPWQVVFKKPDRDLSDKLKAEASGILAWIVEGCVLWQREGLDMPRVVADATEMYLLEEDRLGRWIADRCDIATGNWHASTPLYDDYCRWCERNNERRDSSTWFGTELGKRGFRDEKEGDVRGRRGLTLKKSAPLYDFNDGQRQEQQ